MASLNKKTTPNPFDLICSKACMLYAGLGDAIGFKNGEWEFERDASKILSQVERMGGVANIVVNEEDWPVSDDTVMHIATCIAIWQTFHPNDVVCQKLADLSTAQETFDVLLTQASHIIGCNKPKSVIDIVFDMNRLESFTTAIICWYSKCMSIMNGRAPGRQTEHAVAQYLSHDILPPKKIADNAGGNGAAMRSMCLGLVRASPQVLVSLAGVASIATHTNYTAVLGAIMSAAFTGMAMDAVHPNKWAFLFFANYYPSAMVWLKMQFPNDEPDLHFYNMWQKYLSLRFPGQNGSLGSKTAMAFPKFPSDWLENVQSRHDFFEQFAYVGSNGETWIGSSGHDAVMIAYDSLLRAPDDWHTVLILSAFHGGDSDSTASIAGAFFGALVGMRSESMVGLEFQESIVSLALGLPHLSIQNLPLVLQ